MHIPTFGNCLVLKDDSPGSPNMHILEDELKLLVLAPLLEVSLIRPLTSSTVQSDKYPGLEISPLTPTSLESIGTKRDIQGRRDGEV